MKKRTQEIRMTEMRAIPNDDNKMKIAIIIFAISALITFIKVNCDLSDMLDGTYDCWVLVKHISFLIMIGSFIAVVIMW